MVALLALAFPSMLTLSPFAQALVLDLYNVNSSDLAFTTGSYPSVGVSPNVHCTKDPTWLIPAFPSISTYDSTCQKALAKAIRDLTTYELDTEYEFLTRGAAPQTAGPQLQLPRKYVASAPHFPPCTIALAMITSLEPGDPLPGQPPGSLGSSDIMTVRELLYNPGHLGKTFLQCLRDSPTHSPPHDPSLGWTQTGEHHVPL